MDDTLNSLTVDDLVRAGACIDGVRDFCKVNRVDFASLPTSDVLALCTDGEQRGWIMRAANLDGYGGDGYGYGDGGGDGNGYGYGGGGDGYGYGGGGGYGYGGGNGGGGGGYGGGNGDGDGRGIL